MFTLFPTLLGSTACYICSNPNSAWMVEGCLSSLYFSKFLCPQFCSTCKTIIKSNSILLSSIITLADNIDMLINPAGSTESLVQCWISQRRCILLFIFFTLHVQVQVLLLRWSSLMASFKDSSQSVAVEKFFLTFLWAQPHFVNWKCFDW